MNVYIFSGRVAKDPVTVGDGEAQGCRFTLIANEYAGKNDDELVKTRTVAIPFIAWRGQGRAIAEHARVGDQLIVKARIENNDREEGETKLYGYNFVVTEFDFGAPGQAKREEMAGE